MSRLLKTYSLRIKLYACLVIIFTSAIMPLKVFAVDYDFYSSNDILFYDPNACGGSGDDTATTGNGKVFALGDSLLQLSVDNDLAKKITNLGYTNFKYNAVIGRSISTGGQGNSTAIDGANKNKAAITDAGTILIVLGTNPDDYDSKIPDLMKIIRTDNPDARVFWVNVGRTGNSDELGYMNSANKAITKYSKNSDYDYKVVDWNSVVYPNGSDSADNSMIDSNLNYHPSVPKGVNALVAKIADALGTFSPSDSTSTSPGDLDKFLQGLAMTESGGSYKSGAGTSGAQGRYQILPDYFGSYSGSYPPANKYSPNAADVPGSMQDAMVYLNIYKRYLLYDKSVFRTAASWIWPAAATDPSEMDHDLGPGNGHNTPRTYAQKILKNMDSSAARKIKLNYTKDPDFDRLYKNLDKNRNTPVGSFPGGSSTSEVKSINPGAAVLGATTTSDSPLIGSSNPEKAYNYFTAKGLTALQAVGIMGNIRSESASTWRPDIVQGMTYSDVMRIDGVTGYGLSQWTAINRQQGLHDLSSGRGVKDSDLKTQFDYIWKELNGGYSRALSELKKATSVRDATSAILNYYELPAERVHNLDVRTGYAQQYLDKYGGSLPTAPSTGCDEPSSGSGNTAGQYGWDMTGQHAMTYYSQCDPKWGSEPYGKGKSSICEGGCGITSIAIAIATLTGNSKITPSVLALRYGDKYHTFGTDHALLPVAASDYGLKSKELGTDLNKVAPILKSGGIVIASFYPGAFTSQGHFMVIRAINADGSKFYIADPYKGIHGGSYSADYLRSPGNLGHLWGYYK